MKPEDKKLLLKDLCARLPYNCKVAVAVNSINGLQWNITTLNLHLLYQIEEEDSWEYVKPYLRSMPSMTDKEHRTYISLLAHSLPHTTLEWLNKKHFDYRTNEHGEGLIDKELALEAPKDMYK